MDAALLFQIMYAVIWYLLIVFLGIIFLPVTSRVCGALPDRGYSVSKILSLLFFAYVSWIISYAAGYGRYGIILSLLLVCIVCIFSYIRLKPDIDRALLLRNELVFGSVFLFFLIIRAYNPYIHGGEKVNDFMLLNSILRSDSLPPHDSWFSGLRVTTYYYFGTYVIATLSKITAIPASIAYNLGMSLIPALAANAAFGIGYNLTRSKKAGIFTMFMVVFAGNFYPAAVISANIMGMTESPWGEVPGIIDYWGASRIIPGTITEFPYFSFIFGDLHAHVIAIPFALLVIALILNFYYAKRIPTIGFIFLSLSVGSLFVINSWDYPTYAALFVMVLIIKSAVPEPQSWNGKIKHLLKQAGIGAAILLFGLILFIFFFMDFKPAGIYGIKPVMVRTGLPNFLAIYNLFLFLIISFMLINIPDFRYKKRILALLAISGVALYFFPGFPTLSVFVPLAFLTGLSIYFFIRGNDMERLFVSALIVMGFGILLFCELFYFDDAFSGAEERMNTVFKYYIQVWVLWGTASAYAFYDMCKKTYRMKKVIMAILSILIMLNSVYIFTGTYAKTEGFGSTPNLDGMGFIKNTGFASYDAISWLNMNVRDAAVILEAPGQSFKDMSLISAFTGIPTVIGWDGHEYTWRNNWEQISQRISDVNTIYDTSDYHEAEVLLKKYNVSYVYIGDAELKKYKETGLRKFENNSNFQRVYSGTAEIYRVNFIK